ncbi:MAG: hypothetical protein OJJ55_18985 [Rhodococcus sp.]|nr:hypothetical protein [Rhodococcus sp. (in: high G+C Gram-positive bacteria)]
MSTVTPDRYRELRRLKAEYKEAKQAATDAEAAMKRYQAELFDDMRAEGSMSWKGDDATYSRKSTVYARVDDRDKFHEYIKKHQLEDEFLRETEEKARLNEYVRGLIDNGEELPPGLSFYAQEYISITES